MLLSADDVTDAELKTFVAGDPALASEVNQNFDVLQGAVNDNDARIDGLEIAPPSHTHDVFDIPSGDGSGLDADLLDGHDSSFFASQNGADFAVTTSADINSTVLTDVETVSIDVPARVYVIVVGTCYVNVSHSNGTFTQFLVAVDDAAGDTKDNWNMIGLPDAAASGLYLIPATVIHAYSVSAPGTYTFRLKAAKSQAAYPDGLAVRPSLTAMFFAGRL